MFQVRRIGGQEGELLRELRLAALADAPGDAATTLQRAQAHDLRHWQDAAVANSSGPLQATFVLEAVATWARGEAGARRLRIWVVERNAHARLYYEGQGFRSTGTEIPYQPEPRIRQLEMVRDL